MKSRDVILMAKMGKKNPQLETVSTENDGRDFRGIKDGVKDSGPFPSATTGGSMDILKSYKAVNGSKVPSANVMGELPVMKADMSRRPEGEVELGPTEVKKYSPIKNYLKKGK